MSDAATSRAVPERLQSERLTLCCPHPDFATEMNAAVAGSIDALRPTMEWAQRVPTVEECREHQQSARDAFLAGEDFQLILFRGDRIVGSTGLHRVDWSVPKFEIGYWVRTSDERKGYVTEAVATLTDLVFETLGGRRLEIRASALNLRSRAVPERLGFALEGILRNDALDPDGAVRDTAVYAKVR
jgi:ribosomal-protein-serine acetyltransferase